MDYTALDDRELVRHARNREEAAYRELIARYERPVFSLVYRILGDRASAEDVAQETFVRVFTAIASYDPRYKFSSWIFKIANNLAIDELRRRRGDTLSLDGSPHAASGEEAEQSRLELPSPGEDPAAYAAARELGARIEAAIRDLRPEYRSVILLRHVEGCSYDEIAEILDIPLGTVKTYLHRARLELKERLRPLRE